MKLYKYCQITGKEKTFGSDLKIQIDYGNGLEDFEDENGEIVRATSIVYATNYLIKNGWEFVQAYGVSIFHGADLKYWIFRKEVSSDELDEVLCIYDN